MISSLQLAPFASRLLPELDDQVETTYEKTWQALKQLRQNIANDGADHLLMLSPQTLGRVHTLGLAQNSNYTASLQKIGGPEQTEKIKGAPALNHRLKEKLESLNILALESRDLSLLENIGLHIFWPAIKKLKLMPLLIRRADAAKLYSWGHIFGNGLMDFPEKIAILGLIELSFPANKMLTGLAHKCDQRIIEALKTNEPKKLIKSLALEYNAIKDGSREVVIFMMGLTQNLPGHWEILSNELVAGQRTISAQWYW